MKYKEATRRQREKEEKNPEKFWDYLLSMPRFLLLSRLLLSHTFRGLNESPQQNLPEAPQPPSSSFSRAPYQAEDYPVQILQTPKSLQSEKESKINVYSASSSPDSILLVIVTLTEGFWQDHERMGASLSMFSRTR